MREQEKRDCVFLLGYVIEAPTMSNRASFLDTSEKPVIHSELSSQRLNYSSTGRRTPLGITPQHFQDAFVRGLSDFQNF